MNKNLNFDAYVRDAEKVKAKKGAKERKPSQSIKPLKFEISEEDSPLKTAIIEKINARNLTYADMYEYCTKIKGGDILEGQKFGYNLISGLRNRHSMIDTTATVLCDFLNLDIYLCERKPDSEQND